MKHKLLLFAMILFVASTGINCGKSSNPTPAPQETKLQVTIKDQSGYLVSGATVKIYGSLADFIGGLTGTTPLASGTTSSFGIVTFTNVSTSVKYYIYAEKGCNNNYAAADYGPTSYLINNITNMATCKVAPSGTLTFNNTSSNPYNVYLNGGLLISNMAGGASKSIPCVPADSYTIRVIQQSGYALTPTDKTYTGTVPCGGTLTTTFP